MWLGFRGDDRVGEAGHEGSSGAVAFHPRPCQITADAAAVPVRSRGHRRSCKNQPQMPVRAELQKCDRQTSFKCMCHFRSVCTKL